MGDLGSFAGSDNNDEDRDEESGLTTAERRKFLRRKRRKNRLENRIAGNHGDGVLSQESKKLADRQVLRKILINSALIAAWYTFSLSISIVSLLVCLLSWQGLTTTTVQQMDVLKRPPQLSLPAIYDLPPHGRPIYALSALPTLRTLPPTPSSRTSPPLRQAQTADHPKILPHPPSPLRRHNFSRHRPGQYLTPLHHAHLLHDVQILRPNLGPPLRLSLPPGIPKLEAHRHHPHHGHRRSNDGLRRDGLPPTRLRPRHLRLLLLRLPLGAHPDPPPPPPGHLQPVRLHLPPLPDHVRLPLPPRPRLRRFLRRRRFSDRPLLNLQPCQSRWPPPLPGHPGLLHDRLGIHTAPTHERRHAQHMWHLQGSRHHHRG